LLISAAASSSGVIMGVRHRKYTIEAVQYHPESVLSEYGDQLLRNFLTLKGGLWEQNLDFGLMDATLPPFPIESLASTQLSKEATAKIPSILDKICAQRLTDVQIAKSTPGTTPADLAEILALNLAPPLIPFVSRLKSHLHAYPSSVALMAEFKRASPSKGAIALTASAPSQALIYALSGASVISVLTESHFFKGLLSDLAAARQAVGHLPHRPALLRKDFILDEYQIAEARVHGADTVLLIVATLSPARLRALYDYSLSLGMEPLVEVNNAAEMTIALELGAKVIGVNNRNLHNFDVDTGTTSRLVDMVRGKDVILCALSGISTREDVQQYQEQGVGAVLIGEALMRAPDTRAFISELLGRPSTGISGVAASVPLVKICGIRSADEALTCVSAGADMLGLMFVPSSKRHISITVAEQICSAVRSTSVPPRPSLESPSFSASIPWFTAHATHLTRRRPLMVGVFQNQSLDEISRVLDVVPLDMIQLHGDEPVEWAKFLPVPVIKVFHIKDGEENSENLVNLSNTAEVAVARPGYYQFVLVDSIGDASGLSGGSGKKVDWETAKRIVENGELPVPGSPSAALRYPLPIILAGGLTSANVREAIVKVHPWAVDVSGGVEVEGGDMKDANKVAEFVRVVKGGVEGA
jgi:anthranilate synthase/indole-3-glycerol phosphate synthase/phosphoribosylanthranilate isomerase